MWFKTMPLFPSWYKKTDQLFAEQQKDELRSKLLVQFRNKILHKYGAYLYLSSDIYKDSKTNPIFSEIFNKSLPFCHSPKHIVDLSVKIDFIKSRNLFTIAISNLATGEKLAEYKKQFNPEHSTLDNFEIIFYSLLINKSGDKVIIACYPNFVQKLKSRFEALKWKI